MLARLFIKMKFKFSIKISDLIKLIVMIQLSFGHSQNIDEFDGKYKKCTSLISVSKCLYIEVSTRV